MYFHKISLMNSSLLYFLFTFTSVSLWATGLHSKVWFAQPEVIRGESSGEEISGFVFHDLNRDGFKNDDEPGIPNVLVSNGKNIVRTDENGFFQIPVLEDMNLTIVQPSGWRIPTNEKFVPQFFYIHKPGGSPKSLRFGGLPSTGPAPSQVHFPLLPSELDESFSIAAYADPQTYSNNEIGYLRDGMISSLLNERAGPVVAMIGAGDILGDDLDLLERQLEVGSALEIPQWLVFGNHDLDFDAERYEDSTDSWRRLYGPAYYAFEMGEVLFVVLNNVFYPVDRGGRRPGYNGIVDDQQMEWFENLIGHTPEDRLIVLVHHIPFVSFVDHSSTVHQTDNLTEIYRIVDGREVLSLSGHTHTTENHSPGQFFQGWHDAVGVGPLPFRHIILGAASGSWYQGDFNTFGLPMALQRMGSPPGYFMITFDQNEYRERYVGVPFENRDFWVDLSTPSFRDWFGAINEWRQKRPNERSELPPFSINDLPDTRLLTPKDLGEGVFLTVNVWGGSVETEVTAVINQNMELSLSRTQKGEGEAPYIGAEWADPFASKRQLSVARFAFQSELGDQRAQGWEAFRGSRFGPDVPQPMRAVADRNMHLWTSRLPEDLPLGTHRITIHSKDRHGRVTTEHMIFEVVEARPSGLWRHEPWR